MKRKLFSLFVLLMMAATGAWAQLRTSNGEVAKKINATNALQAPIHKAPSQNNGWYHYDNGSYYTSVGTGGSTLFWGILLPAGSVEGDLLTKVAVYEDDYQNTSPITVHIYAGGDTPKQGTLLYEETVETQQATGFHEITLTTPVRFNSAENLWVILSEYGSHPAAACYNTGDANGRWISLDGNDWSDVTDYGLNYTWMLRAYITWYGDYKFTIGDNPNGTIKFYLNDIEAKGANEGDEVTMVVTPDEGWSLGGIKGMWYAADGSAKAPRRAQSNVDLLKDFELEPVEGQQNTYQFTMKRANAEFSANYRKLLTHIDMTIEDIDTVTYNGQAQTPAVVVKDTTAVLVKDTHYSVSYSDNQNAGTAKATIIGIGLYDGQVVKEFIVDKANITPTAPTAMTQLTFNGQAQTLVAAGSITGPGNMEACEMQYSLDNQTYAKELPTAVNAGSYTVFYKVVGDANHNGVDAQFINVAIYKAALTNVLLEASTLTYNQQEQSPVITSVKAGELVVPATDYTVSGSATNVGTYTMTVMAKESADNFTGTATAQYSIVAADANLFNITLGTSTFTFNGTELKPTVTVKDGEATLVENTDYTLAFTNNVNVGTATVTATGIGNYSGTKTATYTIIKADITPTAPTAQTGLVYTTQPQALIAAGQAEGGEMQYSLDNETWSTNIPTGTEAKEYTVYYKVVADANHNDVAAQSFKVTIAQAELTELILAQTTLTYNQQEQTVAVASVKAGNLPVAADSYEVSGNKGTNVNEYTVTVTGKGNFKNTATAKFNIVPAEAEAKFEITLGTTEYIYDGTAKTPTVTVKDGEATLVENTDYTLAYTANTNAGTATVTVTGKGNYSGTQTATFTIKPATLTSVTLAQTEFQYNLFGPVAQTAEIAEVKAGNLIVPAAQYDVEGNTQTEPDTYTVTVTGKINFEGTVTAQFVIKDQVVDGEGEKTEGGEEIDDINMTVSVVNRTQQTLSIDEITKGTDTGDGITVEIPAQINGWSVVSIAPGAMAGLNNVTDIIMPDTEEPIAVGEGAFPGTATIHTTLALLDDYALMASLKQNYEGAKVVCTVTPVNKYWTLGIGCDVLIPDGIAVHTVQAKSSAEVATELIPEDLLKNGNERIIKANNGVLLLGNAGQSYDLVAYSGRIASGMPVATSDNKDYGSSNCLEPVIEKKHYDSGHYFVLQNNEFHAILAEGDEVKVPAGKAVLHLGNDQAGANARVLLIDDSATGVKEVIEVKEVNDDRFYDLSGRKVNAPTKKGVYLFNGRKVVVK